METLITFSMIIVCFNFLLKQTYHKWWIVAVNVLVIALFSGLMWRFAVLQSKTQIADWLSNQKLMLDIAVILSIDIILQLSFCVLFGRQLVGEKISMPMKVIYRCLKFFPGIAIFPVLFGILTILIFTFPGMNFKLISWSFAAAVAIIIPITVYVINTIIPEKELRTELLFFSNCLLAILGIISTVNGNVAVQGISEVNFGSLLCLVALLAAFGCIGFIIQEKLLKRKIKKLNKN